MASKQEPKPTAVRSAELEYKPMEYIHPQYRMNRINQQTGNATVTLSATGTQDATFQIPSKAFSFAESYITGTFTPAAGGGGIYHQVATDVPFINTIQAFTQGGTYLCNIENLINYQKVTRPANTSLDTFLTNDPSSQLYPINTDGQTDADGQRPSHTAASRPYMDIHTYTVGAAASATPVVPFVFRLGDIAETIFSMKKAFWFPEFIYLKVTLGPVGKFMWDTTVITNPATTAADPAVGGTFSNFYLNLATEQNEEVSKGLMAQILTDGIKLPIPYVYTQRMVVTASTSQTVTAMIQPDKGYILKKIIHAVFDANESKNVANDHSNINGSKIERYSTLLDSTREQENDIDCKTNYDDYDIHRQVLKKSCLQNRNMYQYGWFHMQDYSNLNISTKASLSVPAENLISGVPIEGGKQWVFSGNRSTAGTFNHYTFMVCYQNLVLRPDRSINMEKKM